MVTDGRTLSLSFTEIHHDHPHHHCHHLSFDLKNNKFFFSLHFKEMLFLSSFSEGEAFQELITFFFGIFFGERERWFFLSLTFLLVHQQKDKNKLTIRKMLLGFLGPCRLCLLSTCLIQQNLLWGPGN